MENECIQCGTLTKNKKYCSTNCQRQGYKKPKNERIKIVCLQCKIEFEAIKPAGKQEQRQYCSRDCKDTHQKEKYTGIGNPVFGREASDEERQLRSEMVKKMWQVDGHKEKVQAGQEKFKEENGYCPGTDKSSIKKRKETFFEKYGVDHNWKNKENRAMCDITSLRLYGETALEMATKKLFKTAETSIEKKTKEILINNKIKFKKNFYIYFNEKEYKIFDFYLPEYNMLIETDGDYWHGNPEYFTTLNEIQEINRKNDTFKNELANQEGYSLLRFWENQIKSVNFEIEFLEAIKNG